MRECDLCGKEFKNSKRLHSHKYNFHKLRSINSNNEPSVLPLVSGVREKLRLTLTQESQS